MPRLVLHGFTPLLALSCALAACGTAADATRDHGAPGSLRAAVFAHYDELAHAKALPQANGGDRADFSGVVAPFVRPGMRFEDAAALLKQNGFGVRPLPPRAAPSEKAADASRDDLLANLQVANWVLVGRADLYCQLAPATVADATTVGAVHCWLTTGML